MKEAKIVIRSKSKAGDEASEKNEKQALFSNQSFKRKRKGPVSDAAEKDNQKDKPPLDKESKAKTENQPVTVVSSKEDGETTETKYRENAGNEPESTLVHLQRIREKHRDRYAKAGVFDSNMDQEDFSLDEDAVASLSRKEKKKTRGSWYRHPLLQTMITILGAVGLGMLFGWFVLTTFVQQEWGNLSSPLSETTSQRPVSPTEVKNEAMAKMPSLSMPSLPSKRFYMVQAGAFRDRGQAEAIVRKIQDRGRAAMIFDKGDAFYLMTGVAVDPQVAENLADHYRQLDWDIYVKVWDIPGVTEDDQTSSSPYSKKLDRLMEDVSQITAAGLRGTGEDTEKLPSIEEAVLSEGKKQVSSWSQPMQDKGEEMLSELSRAFEAVETYRETASVSELWIAQQALLHYVAQYEKLVRTAKERKASA